MNVRTPLKGSIYLRSEIKKQLKTNINGENMQDV
jgi:hypothetical protein